MPEDTTDPHYDDRRMGQRLRNIRNSRRMTLRVLADFAGTSTAKLSKIENGITALDSRKLIVALAKALHVAPSDLTSLPIPAPVNGNTDSSVEAVRRALIVVTAGNPGGEVQSVEQLRHRFSEVTSRSSDWHSRGVGLPSFIIDLHTTLAQRQGMSELLPLAVRCHTETVISWLYTAGASTDLRWQEALLAQSAAQELNDPVWLGMASWCASMVMLGNCEFDLARKKLNATMVPTTSSRGMQMDGMLALSRSLVSAADGHPAESSVALDHAGSLAARTGEGGLLGFGPVNVGLWRMAATLESGRPDESIRVAEALNPLEHPSLGRRASYWMDYGRALTKVKRRDDAARAMLTAEKLYPVRVLRNPLARDNLVELVAHSKDNKLGREIRRMAYRAGLPV